MYNFWRGWDTERIELANVFQPEKGEIRFMNNKIDLIVTFIPESPHFSHRPPTMYLYLHRYSPQPHPH